MNKVERSKKSALKPKLANWKLDLGI